MPLINSKYKSPRWLRNPHTHTVLCALVRKRPQIAYLRERLELPDGDFIDLDWSTTNSKRLVIFTHGMEGSSQSKYILHCVQAAKKNNYSALAWNMRGCSGTPNRKLHFYHSGLTDDLHHVVQHAIRLGYREIYLAGFSLGGNLTLLYLARQYKQVHRYIRATVAVSAPVDLASSQQKIETKENRIYLKRFLKDFKKKYNRKRELRQIYIDTKNFHKHITSLAALDATYTAPWSNFANEQEYYKQCSSLPLLQQIHVPSLLLNPRDDTFLSNACYPSEFAARSKYFYLETPSEGGHCAMLLDYKFNKSYIEQRVFEFFAKLS